MKKFTSVRSLYFVLLIVLPTLTACKAGASDPDPANELPFGFIDAPKEGASVNRQVQMYGWALDDGGIADVRLFVDGRFVRNVKTDQARPDLTSVYPSYT